MSQTPLRPRRGWIKRALIIGAAAVVVIVGLLVGGVRLLDQFAPQYRNALVARIGERIDAHVTTDGLSLGWGWHGPILYLSDVRIVRHGQSQPALTAQRVGFEFSLAALASGHRLPDGVLLEAPKARLVVANGRLQLAHWPAGSEHRIGLVQLEELRKALRNIAIRNGDLGLASSYLPGGSVRLRNLDLSIDAPKGDPLEARLSASGPGWLPQIGAHARLIGPLNAPDRLGFSAHLDRLDPLALAHAASAKPAALTGGQTDITLHGAIAGQRLVDTRLRMQSAAVHRAGRATPASDSGKKERNTSDTPTAAGPLVPAFTAVFGLGSDIGLQHLKARLLQFSTAQQTPGDLAAQLNIDTQQPALTATARNLPSALVLRLARWAVPKLADTAISGTLSKARLAWSPGTPLALDAVFSDLRVDDPAITFGPVSGRYRQQGQQHVLHFTGAHGTLSAQRYLHGALAISDLSGGVAWQRTADGALAVSLDDLTLASRDAQIQANGTARWPGAGGAPIVDLTAEASAPDIARLLNRLPQAPDLPNPRLREWLPQAITAGTLTHAHLEVRGPMNRFPFAHAHGNEGFHVALSGHGVDVHYKDGWPTLKNARAQLAIDGDTLDLTVARAEMLGVTIDQAKIHVADVREPILKLQGTVKAAPADRLLAFLGASPLRDRFGALIRAVKVSGPADLGIDLSLPLKAGLGDPVVNGTVTAHGDTLREAHLPGPLTAIRGKLQFSGDGLRADDLAARLLGIPLRADLAPADDKRQQIVAHATPSLPDDRAALAHYLPAPWLVYGAGPLPLRVAFSLDGHGAISPITITSNLAGTAIRLPTPLAKPAAQTAPLQVVVDPTRHTVVADYDHDLHMAVDLGESGPPRRIVVKIGDRDIHPPDSDGLWIGGRTAKVDGLGWFDVVRHIVYGSPADVVGGDKTSDGDSGDGSPAKTTTPRQTGVAALPFLGGDLTIGQLDIGDRYIAGVQVRAEPLGHETGWRINLEGPNSQGQIRLTDAPGTALGIAGNLRRVAIQTQPAESPPAPSAKSSAQPADTLIWPQLSPLDLPALQLYIQNFVVDDTDFGKTHVDAHQTATGWHLDRFALDGGALTGHLSAVWLHDRALTSATASAEFEGSGLSQLVRTFGYPSPVRAKHTAVDAELSIAPNSAGLDLRELNGRLHLALDNGTFVTVEPGPGRLLGLFNLYVLPRRLLNLNFRDVVDKGLAFDKVRADFKIRDGQAYCQSATIKTPSSNIDITGRIGIATRDYDEQVNIKPKVGSSVALAGTVLGGPIVGAAVFAIQQILKKPIEHFSALSYRLQGNWDDPKIIEPKAESLDTQDNTATKDTAAPATDTPSATPKTQHAP